MSGVVIGRPGGGEGVEGDAATLTALCASLKAGGGAALAPLGWEEALAGVSAALAALRDASHPIRQRLEAQAAAELDDLAMWRYGLETTLAAWGPADLRRLLARTLGEAAALDRWIAVDAFRQRRAYGPSLLVHVQSGNLGAPGLEGMLSCALLKAPMLIRRASHDDGLARAFADALVEAQPRYRDAIALCRWPSDDKDAWQAVLTQADVLLVHGGDEAVGALRTMAPATTRVVAHPHRLSVAWVGRGAQASAARPLMMDFFAYEQSGCLSPRVVFVEGDDARARRWAERLAEAAEAVDQSFPRSYVDAAVLAEGVQAAGRLAFTGEVLRRGAFTVAVETGPFRPSPTGRFVVVRSAATLGEAMETLGPWLGRVQGVSVAESVEQWGRVSDRWASMGAGWVAAAGALQTPGAGWPADGRPILSDLLRWSERTVSVHLEGHKGSTPW